MKSMIIILVTLFSFAACSLPDLPASIIIGTTDASKVFTEHCEKPKVFLECGSACPPTCAKPKPTVCTLQCVKGCFCPKGTFLNDSGKCVEKCSSNGNPWCPNSKVYTECGSLCPRTCANPNPGPCADVCVKGCFCPKGTLENSAGECVKQCSSNGSNSSGSGSSASSSASSSSSSASSSSSSGSNPWCPNTKVYTDCGSACPPTCANPNPEACGSACVKGCFCPKGTLENAAGECVEQCSTNGSNSSGNGSTSSSSASSASSASSSSGSGPVSNDGFIPKVNNDCGSACPPTCANPNPVCTKQCVKGAFCPDGTFENASGNCVKTC